MIPAALNETTIITPQEEIKKAVRQIASEGNIVKHIKRNETLFYEGQQNKGFYIINSGLIKTYMKGCHNRDLLIAISGKDEYTGYKCILFNCQLNKTTAVALTDAEVLFVSRQAFEVALKNNYLLKRIFLEMLGQHYQELSRKMLDLAYKPVRGRLADALLALDQKMSCTGEDRMINLTRNEMADHIGSVRETTTRLLSEFRDDGVIEISSDCIRVINHEKLKFISSLYK